ncbi:GNAT family N-acetyltransferase [Chitinimonas lacunae]|uniref:GNAT family N-acetyltransferase n=1 Tax=Chitinimonas lacunae TaxID=1963018 RepID=A0ABV8MXC7_9NEIS
MVEIVQQSPNDPTLSPLTGEEVTVVILGGAAPVSKVHHICLPDLPSVYACQQQFELIIADHLTQAWTVTGVLQAARKLLAEHGKFIVTDCFCTNRNGWEKDQYAYLPHFEAQAERLGLQIVDSRTLSDDTYSITLQLGPKTRWQSRIFLESELAQFQELFHNCFNSEISRQLWFWKYAENRGQQIGVWLGDEMVGHYGGMTRRILLQGKPVLACQIGDVMVKPSERGVLSRRGPLAQGMATYAENWCGWGSQHPIGFGFPNARHMGAAERLGLYAEVGAISQIDWDTDPRRFDWKYRAVLAKPDTATINRLWSAMAADFNDGIIGVRDQAHLQHRYYDHPHHDYQIWSVAHRLTGRPLGILVLRSHGESIELIDLLAPRRAITGLVDKARRIAASQGASRLFCWISEPYAEDFVATGGKRSDPDVRIPTNIWTDGPAPHTLRNRWWLMGGDTDFR